MSSARFFNFCAANALDTTLWKHVDGTWQVIKDIDASDLQIELLDWQIDSRHVQPGDIFCSLPRAQFTALSDDLRAKKHQEMTSYIKMAIDRGARIIVSEESPYAFAIKDLSSDIFWVETRDICESLFAWLSDYYLLPTLSWFGITGTNGKTTTAYYLSHLLSEKQQRSLYIGTLGVGEINQLKEATHTTPDMVNLIKSISAYLAEHDPKKMATWSVVMEVSAHAIDQKRVYGIPWTGIACTNLSHDHLDYFGDLEAYYQTKLNWLTQTKAQLAALNLDAPYPAICPVFCAERQLGFCVNFEKAPHAGKFPIPFRSTIVAESAHGTEVVIKSDTEEKCGTLPIRGEHNVSNIMLAMTLSSVSLDFNTIWQKSLVMPAVPGRFNCFVEPDTADPRVVVVDYAHTPDALSHVIKTARSTFDGYKIGVIFGCGGDRDRDKRPVMGEIAALEADYGVITSDNPRAENAEKIIEEILSGIPLTARNKWQSVENRQDAIEHTIQQMQPKSCLIIAGKGHETYQEINGTRHAFSDEACVHRAISLWSAN